MELLTIFKQFLNLNGSGAVYLHSDISKVSGTIPRQKDMNDWLAEHIRFLEEACSPTPIIFPTFNYQFLKEGEYNLSEDKSEVGALSEYARKHWATWRSNTPVFNYIGNKNSALLHKHIEAVPSHVIDPFDERSIFHYLYENNGTILMYGAPFSSFTGIHHIEHLAGRPLYRYDKDFSGKIIGTNTQEVTLHYHVRPMGLHLNYRWDELLELSKQEGIAKEFKQPRVQILAFSYKELADFWLRKMQQDPLFLIDEQSKKECSAILKKLGRRFIQSDFEKINE